MRNKVIIPANSGLNPRDHARALEVLAEAPLDILSFFPDVHSILVYPKLRIHAPHRRGQRISYSHLTPVLSSPFYKIKFYGETNYQAEECPGHNPNRMKVFDYTLFSGEEHKIGRFWHSDYHPIDEQVLSTNSHGHSFSFIFKIPLNNLLDKDGNPLFRLRNF